MAANGGNDPLFVVDNSDENWKGLDYLREWCSLASQFDIATGNFEVGSLFALEGDWQKLDKIRLLMGDEMTYRTKKAMLRALTDRAVEVVDAGLELDKAKDPFLSSADSVVEALKSKKIEARVYNRDKFHAKAYITHARSEVIGSAALVGSSNFTVPGLTQNVELNIKVESTAEVAQLQRWYERHWDDAVEITPEILQTIERHTRDYTPFEVWARALHEMFAEHEETGRAWDESGSLMFPKLDRYQQEAYWALMDIERRHGGAFLCDGVGLGKTFVGLMLIERLVVHERKRVVVFAPKSAKESVWLPALRKHLPHLGGTGGGGDFSNLVVFSHTDLNRKGDFPERFERITEMADAIVIDEAHHFRNTGKDAEEWNDKSRYWRLFDLLGGDEVKSLFMLTATPINNSLDDFRHMLELFTRRNETHFARSLGVPNVRGRINQLAKDLKTELGDDVVADFAGEAAKKIEGDPLFEGLVVQRSRAYARRSQEQQHGEAAAFPEREAPELADYSVRKTYGKLLQMVEGAFAKDKPLFALPMYYPLAYYNGPDPEIDPILENRQQQVVGLIRTNFLKRFESSVHAFERSCDRLLRKLIAFVQANAETDAEKKVLDTFIARNDRILGVTRVRQLTFFPEAETEADEEEDDDVVSPELLAAVEVLDRSEFDVPAILAETYQDMQQLVDFLEETTKFEPRNDDKLQRLVKLLGRKEMKGRKLLIFTEFADTARYLRAELEEKGFERVFALDSSTKADRAEVLRRFAPYYNDSSSQDLMDEGKEEIDILVATDVLSEGLNLQDATRLVNYDIHWNPVRLMQRIGRVDRRLDPAVEARMVKDHPELADQRGKVKYFNFLPPDDLDGLLRLYSKVSGKVLLISKALGIEHGKLLGPGDEYEMLQEFNAGYEGEATEIEELHLEYQQLLLDHPGLDQRLDAFPGGVFSGRSASEGQQVFFCYRLPALDVELGEFTLEAGITRWYLYDVSSGSIIESAPPIADVVRSNDSVPRELSLDRPVLLAARDEVRARIRDSHLKQLDAPLDAPDPKLICWMELAG